MLARTASEQSNTSLGAKTCTQKGRRLRENDVVKFLVMDRRVALVSCRLALQNKVANRIDGTDRCLKLTVKNVLSDVRLQLYLSESLRQMKVTQTLVSTHGADCSNYSTRKKCVPDRSNYSTTNL